MTCSRMAFSCIRQSQKPILFSEEHPLSVQSTISISTDLEIRIYHNGQLVPASIYKHIVLSNKVTLLSQVTNLMAFAKNTGCLKSKYTL